MSRLSPQSSPKTPSPTTHPPAAPLKCITGSLGQSTLYSDRIFKLWLVSRQLNLSMYPWPWGKGSQMQSKSSRYTLSIKISRKKPKSGFKLIGIQEVLYSYVNMFKRPLTLSDPSCRLTEWSILLSLNYYRKQPGHWRCCSICQNHAPNPNITNQVFTSKAVEDASKGHPPFQHLGLMEFQPSSLRSFPCPSSNWP